MMPIRYRIIAAIITKLNSIHEHVTYQKYRQKYNIDPSMKFNGKDIVLYGDGKILIGEGSYIGRRTQIQAGKERIVKIGKYCSISHNVAIYTESNRSEQIFKPNLVRKKKTGDVCIEDFVWVGYGVYIGPGITIGENAVVGANSVVVKDIPAYAIVGGVPAKIIKWKDSKQV